MALLLCAAPVCVCSRVEAQSEGVVYRPEWRKFGAVDYVVTGAMAAAAVTLELTKGGPTEATWTEPIPYIDRPAREVLVGPSREARVRATKISDALWYASMAYPVFDVLLTPPLRNSSYVPVWQMTMMNVQAYAAAALLVRPPQKFIGRTRPTVVGCKEDPEYSSQCGRNVSLVSFPGGHFAASMTGAGLSCAHHLHGELYGGGAADVIACGSALGTASMAGYLRLYADEHWLSDQLIGGAMGLFSGYALPTLLYYRPFWGDAARRAPVAPAAGALRWSIVPKLTRDTLGMSLLLVQ